MKKRILFLDNQSGFTLIEILIALAIFTIGILSVNAMQTASIKGNGLANRITISTCWMSDRVEQIMGTSYDDLNDDDGDGDAALNDFGCCPGDGCAAEADGCDTTKDNYTIFWNVAEDYPIRDLKTVRVIVKRDEKGDTRLTSVDYIKRLNL